MQSRVLEMIKKQLQKTFILTFNNKESIYTQEQELNIPFFGSGKYQMVMIGDADGSDLLYKNTKLQHYVKQVDAYGKIFLVKDQIEILDWKLGTENKHIGENHCYQANYTKMVP